MAMLTVGANIAEPVAGAGELTQHKTSEQVMFSTSLGTMEPLAAKHGMASVIVHEDDGEAAEAHAAHLKKRFPEECKEILDAETALAKFFDPKAIYITGVFVLKAALSIIARDNRMRKDAVKAYAEDFYQHHKFRAYKFLSSGRTSIFNDEETKECGEEFLGEVLSYLKENYQSVEPLTLVTGRSLNPTTIQTSIPPVSPSPVETPAIVRQAQEEKVYRIPIHGGDNKLHPRRGSAPPVMEEAAVIEFRRQAEQAATANTMAAPQMGTAVQQPSDPNVPITRLVPASMTGFEMSRESTLQSWQSHPSLIAEGSNDLNTGPTTIVGSVDESMLSPIDELRAPSTRDFSGQSNPSMDGRYGSPHPGLTALSGAQEDNKNDNFDTPQLRRPRGDSLVHRGPAHRYAAHHRLNRGPPRHQNTRHNQHVPQGMPPYPPVMPQMASTSSMAPNVPLYAMFPGNQMPMHPVHMGPGAQMAMHPMGMSPGRAMNQAVPQQMGHGAAMSPRSGSQHGRSTQNPYVENMRPAPHNAGMQYANQYVQQSVQPPMMVGPPQGQFGSIPPPFYPVPYMPQQFGYVSPPPMAPEQVAPASDSSVSGQMSTVENAASQPKSEARAHKHPRKSFTNDARVLENMAEEDLPLHQQLARRRSSASTHSNGFAQAGGQPHRLSRENSQTGPQPLMHIPENVPAQAAMHYPSPPHAYFGYAMRDPNDGNFANFEPVHPAFKTNRGKREVLNVLRASEAARHSQQVHPQVQQMPVQQVSMPHEQPLLIQQPVQIQDETFQDQDSMQSVKPGEANQSEDRDGTPPPKVVPRPGLAPTFVPRERDPNKVWISGKFLSEELVRPLLSRVGNITEMSRIFTKKMYLQAFNDCQHNVPYEVKFRYAFVTFEHAQDAARACEQTNGHAYSGGFLKVDFAFKNGNSGARDFSQASFSAHEQPRQVSNPIYMPGSEPVIMAPNGERLYRAGTMSSFPSSKQLWKENALTQPSLAQMAKEEPGIKSRDPKPDKGPKTPSPAKKSKANRKKRTNSAQSSAPVSRKGSEMALASITEKEGKGKTEKQPKTAAKLTATAESVETPKEVEARAEPQTEELARKQTVEEPTFDGAPEEAPKLSSSPISQDDSIIAAKLVCQTAEEFTVTQTINVGATSTSSTIEKQRQSPPSSTVTAPALPAEEGGLVLSRVNTAGLLEEGLPPVPVVRLPSPMSSEPESEELAQTAKPSADAAVKNSDTPPVESMAGQPTTFTFQTSTVYEVVPLNSSQSQTKSVDIKKESAPADLKVEETAKTLEHSAPAATESEVLAASEHEVHVAPGGSSLDKAAMKPLDKLSDDSKKTVDVPPKSEQDPAEDAQQNARELKQRETESAADLEKPLGAMAQASEKEKNGGVARTLEPEAGEDAKSPPEQSSLDEEEYPTLATSAQLAKTTPKRSPPQKKAKVSTEKVSYSVATKRQPPKVALPSKEDILRNDAQKSARAKTTMVQTFKAAKPPRPAIQSLGSVSASFDSKPKESSEVAPRVIAQTSTPKTSDSSKPSSESKMQASGGNPSASTVSEASKATQMKGKDSVPEVTNESVAIKAGDSSARSTGGTKPLKQKKAKPDLAIRTRDLSASDSYSGLATSKSVGSTDATTLPNSATHPPPEKEDSMAPVSTHKKSIKKKRSPQPSVKMISANAAKSKEESPPPAQHTEPEKPVPKKGARTDCDADAEEETGVEPKSSKSPPCGYSRKEGDIRPERVEMISSRPAPPTATNKTARPEMAVPETSADHEAWKSVMSKLPKGGKTGQIVSLDRNQDKEANKIMQSLNTGVMLEEAIIALTAQLGRKPRDDELDLYLLSLGHQRNSTDVAKAIEEASSNITNKQLEDAGSATATRELDETSSVTARGESSASGSDANKEGNQKSAKKSGKNRKKRKKSKAKKAASQDNSPPSPADKNAKEASTPTEANALTSQTQLYSTGQGKSEASHEAVLLNPESVRSTVSSPEKASDLEIRKVIRRDVEAGVQSGPPTPTKEGKVIAFVPTRTRETSHVEDAFAKELGDYNKQKLVYEAKRNSAKSFQEHMEEKLVIPKFLRKARRNGGGLPSRDNSVKPADQQAAEEASEPSQSKCYVSASSYKDEPKDARPGESDHERGGNRQASSYIPKISPDRTPITGKHQMSARSGSPTKGIATKGRASGLDNVFEFGSESGSSSDGAATPKRAPPGDNIMRLWDNPPSASDLGFDLQGDIFTDPSPSTAVLHTSEATESADAAPTPDTSAYGKSPGNSPPSIRKASHTVEQNKRPLPRSPPSSSPQTGTTSYHTPVTGKPAELVPLPGSSSCGSASDNSAPGTEKRSRLIKQCKKSRSSSRLRSSSIAVSNDFRTAPSSAQFTAHVSLDAAKLSETLSKTAALSEVSPSPAAPISKEEATTCGSVSQQSSPRTIGRDEAAKAVDDVRKLSPDEKDRACASASGSPSRPIMPCRRNRTSPGSKSPSPPGRLSAEKYPSLERRDSTASTIGASSVSAAATSTPAASTSKALFSEVARTMSPPSEAGLSSQPGALCRTSSVHSTPSLRVKDAPNANRAAWESLKGGAARPQETKAWAIPEGAKVWGKEN